MEYVMAPDVCVVGHEPPAYEVWCYPEEDSKNFKLLEYIPSDSAEVFAAACFNV